MLGYLFFSNVPETPFCDFLWLGVIYQSISENIQLRPAMTNRKTFWGSFRVFAASREILNFFISQLACPQRCA
jgi:hypothetical protein